MKVKNPESRLSQAGDARLASPRRAADSTQSGQAKTGCRARTSMSLMKLRLARPPSLHFTQILGHPPPVVLVARFSAFQCSTCRCTVGKIASGLGWEWASECVPSQLSVPPSAPAAAASEVQQNQPAPRPGSSWLLLPTTNLSFSQRITQFTRSRLSSLDTKA